MSDELENVDAGSETSGEQAAETSQEDTAAETTEVSEETTADAGGAAEQKVDDSETSEQAPVDSDESRTGFVETPARTGDSCICPDGRPGTVTVFAGNLAVCLPNHQG